MELERQKNELVMEIQSLQTQLRLLNLNLSPTPQSLTIETNLSENLSSHSQTPIPQVALAAEPSTWSCQMSLRQQISQQILSQIRATGQSFLIDELISTIIPNLNASENSSDRPLTAESIYDFISSSGKIEELTDGAEVGVSIVGRPGSVLKRNLSLLENQVDEEIFNFKNEADEKEQLIKELNMTLKQKVELQKELGRVGKEIDRVKQNFTDKLSKLEREIESTQREITKRREINEEKDQ
ncbi:hypothetical protein HK096_011293, partial [Nowakowskiella sp. JEL0078]